MLIQLTLAFNLQQQTLQLILFSETGWREKGEVFRDSAIKEGGNKQTFKVEPEDSTIDVFFHPAAGSWPRESPDFWPKLE